MPTHKKGHDKDKYYQLAKDQGYRSRAAFKLIQINKRYDFLRKSKVLIDLCAAPGGWCQVAAKFMPAGSLVIGVDLLPIKAIRGVKTIVGDITTASCRKDIVKELQGWKADVVLCDGAPNIGSAYNKDAYVQNELVLAALKTACDHLVKGGIFCSKIYRSVDYNSLIWVLQQLFEDIQTMKPNSSRSQSSEIFVICLGYLSPKTIDSKLFDPNHVFKEVADPGLKKVDVLHKKYDVTYKKNRSGYDESLGITLHSSTTVGDFILSKEPIRLLSDYNSIKFTPDCEIYLQHPKTTEEVKIALSDLKVLGKIDFKKLLKWRQILRDEFHPQVNNVQPKKVQEVEEEIDSEQEMEEQLHELKDKMLQKEKKEKKKSRKELQKERLRQSLGMTNNAFDVENDAELFNLKENLTDKDINKINDINLEEIEEEDFFEDSENDNEEDNQNTKGLVEIIDPDLEDELEDDYVKFLKDRRSKHMNKTSKDVLEEDRTFSSKKILKDENEKFMNTEDFDSKTEKARSAMSTAVKNDLENYLQLLMGNNSSKSTKSLSEQYSYDPASSDSDDSHDEIQNVVESDEEENGDASGSKPFVTQDIQSLKARSGKWFSNPLFTSGVVEDHEEVSDEDKYDFMPKTDKEKRQEKRKKAVERQEKKESRKRNLLDIDDDDEDKIDPNSKKIKSANNIQSVLNNDFEVVPKQSNELDIQFPERVDDRLYDSDHENYDNHDKLMTLALGTYMLRQSRKKALIDASYNKYSWNDPTGLPSWFVDDEMRHNKPQIPVPNALIDQIKNKYQLKGSKVIKKVAEARARKKKRAMLKLKAAKKQASVMAENSELSEKQKLRAISKAMNNVKGEKSSKVYVATKKTKAGSVGSMTSANKGKLKFVDKRMKKDRRAMKVKEKKGRK